jgi:hypothetical protein
VRILVERPVRAPGGQGPGRSAIPVVGLVARLGMRKVEPDHVRAMPCEQRGVLFLADHVVRRCDHGRDVADDGRLEPERSKRADLGHAILASTPRRRTCWNARIVR